MSLIEELRLTETDRISVTDGEVRLNANPDLLQFGLSDFAVFQHPMSVRGRIDSGAR